MEIRSESLSDFNLIPNSELSVGTETPSNRIAQAGGFFWSKSAPTAICQKAIKAAMEQKHDVVDFLVMEGCLPDYGEVDENKNTLLHHIGGDYSNFDKYPAIVDKILKDPNVKEFIDIQNVDGNTPLHIAAIAGNTDMARKLHEAGASLDIKNSGGFQVAALTVDSDMQTEVKPTHAAASANANANANATATTESIKEMVDKYIESPKKTVSVGGSSVDTEKFLNELATKYAKQTGGNNGCDCDCCDHPGVPKSALAGGAGSELESSDLIPPFMLNDKNLTTIQVQQLGYSKEQLLKSGVTEKRVKELLPEKPKAEFTEPERKFEGEFEGELGINSKGGARMSGGADPCDCECDCHYPSTGAPGVSSGLSSSKFDELLKKIDISKESADEALREAHALRADEDQLQTLIRVVAEKYGPQDQPEKVPLGELPPISDYVHKNLLQEVEKLGLTDVDQQILLNALADAMNKPQDADAINLEVQSKLTAVAPTALQQLFRIIKRAREAPTDVPFVTSKSLIEFMRKKFEGRPFSKDDPSYVNGLEVVDWMHSTEVKLVFGTIEGKVTNVKLNAVLYKVKFNDGVTREKSYRFIVPYTEYDQALKEYRGQKGGGDFDPTMTESFLSGLLVQLNGISGGSRQSNKVRGTRKLNLITEDAHDGDRHSQLARMMANQSNEIHKQVLEKIIKFLPKLDKKYAKLDEKELDDVGRNYKAVLWQIVKQNKDLVSNLDQSNKLLELTTLKELKNINPEEGKKLREESRKRREERQKDKKPKREPKDAPKVAEEGDYDLSDTSSDFVPQAGGRYSQTSFSFNMLTE
jgi:hypothetical protein